MSEAKSIAIIDDDASMLDATENLVRSYGFKVCKFTSAESYLASAGDTEIDCLITDVQMDGISGVELSQILWESGVKTPIIFITAFPDERIRNRVMAAGAIGFLGKPFESKSLIDCIERALTH
ncbi:response regulator transcription factor [Phyllobacterium meliloti]|uniref:response regulator transcription factor n=1 Tax=Phyllobacterium meliloti TaxID=555317 RepID=UPI001D14BC9E|nr:response regulator [Phyllobacterium sp. T1293]UGX88761.1 response regulator [Phyllobacterium sp. T1293]